MSYILDALRKSEQQRQLGVAPRLLAFQAPPKASAKPMPLKSGLIALALMGAGAAIGWLHPWQREQVFSAPEFTAAEPRESRPPQPLAAPLPVSPEGPSKSAQDQPAQTSVPAKPAPIPALVIVKREARPITQTPVGVRKSPAKTSVVAAKEATTPVTTAHSPEKSATPAVENLAVAASTDTPLEQKVIALAELPPAIQQEIPQMSIPVHSYSSTPKERIVGINDRLLQEGDYLAPGLKLEEITPDGVVFSYKKYLFRHGL